MRVRQVEAYHLGSLPSEKGPVKVRGLELGLAYHLGSLPSGKGPEA